MVAILFWNVGQADDPNPIAEACYENDIDILLLAECPIPSTKLVTAINNSRSSQMFFEHVVGYPTVRFFTRLPSSSVTSLSDGRRFSIREVTPPIGNPILIAAAHLPSKLHAGEFEQYLAARNLRQEIEEAEVRVGHRNSIVIGDLNMNPFEPGMAALDGLQGMMTKDLASRLPRSVQGVRSDYFYNPMWSRMGDASIGPPGTYYYDSGKVVNYRWNTFDQVLMRPEVFAFYDDDRLRVLTEVGGKSLLSGTGLGSFSDHLPIAVDFKL
ncbi:endonuclease/exonuclease/phosphatase family protein [Mesorhizobium sp. CA7]|uniref:endonuclease/exonuclease/phosphatase family protein n=1 Tax=Mesorhizobium sp. CA7 TaxID=588501 RepID=UPI001CCBFDB4|nr:endonuclease/exonuclease/phosphatase family protein [Mesorhizobium sp. CA7]MBZ9817448.1 hypothetical protein [Mesorhizobium sp. CA7]